MSNPDALLAQIAELKKTVAGHHQAEQKLWRKFNGAVRAYRLENRLSLDEFAKKIGIGRSFLSYLETGGRGWTLELARKAAKAMA